MKKLEKKYRGSAAYFDDGSMEFAPQGTGEPKYEHRVTKGASFLGVTTGSANQSVVAHLKAPADVADPAEALRDALEGLLKKQYPAPAAPAKPRGRVLMNENGVFCNVNPKTGQMRISLDLTVCEISSLQKKVITNLTNLTQCLYINKEYLQSVVRALQTPSGK